LFDRIVAALAAPIITLVMCGRDRSVKRRKGFRSSSGTVSTSLSTGGGYGRKKGISPTITTDIAVTTNRASRVVATTVAIRARILGT
jgi:hypothetical protein